MVRVPSLLGGGDCRGLCIHTADCTHVGVVNTPAWVEGVPAVSSPQQRGSEVVITPFDVIMPFSPTKEI